MSKPLVERLRNFARHPWLPKAETIAIASEAADALTEANWLLGGEDAAGTPQEDTPMTDLKTKLREAIARWRDMPGYMASNVKAVVDAVEEMVDDDARP